jgi:hypothetical protein
MRIFQLGRKGRQKTNRQGPFGICFIANAKCTEKAGNYEIEVRSKMFPSAFIRADPRQAFFFGGLIAL